MQSIHITTSITREEIDSFISRGEMNVTHSMLISDLSVSVVQLLCNILSSFQVIFLILFTIHVLVYSLIDK